MTDEQLRDYILHRYIDAGGRLNICDFDVFGFATKSAFLLKLAALEKSGIIFYQRTKRTLAVYEVCDYFYAKQIMGDVMQRSSLKLRENKKIRLRRKPTACACKDVHIKSGLVRKMQMPNIGELLGAKRAVRWVRGTYKGEPCRLNKIVNIATQNKQN